MKVDLAALLNVAVQVSILVAALAAGYVGLRRWVQKAARPAQEAADQLKTSNGHTAGQLVEQTAADLTVVHTKVTALASDTAAIRDLAVAATALANSVSARLDDHLRTHGEGNRS